MVDNAIEVILFMSMTAVYVIADRVYLLKPALTRRRLSFVRNRSAER
jgi:hypothetical protein